MCPWKYLPKTTTAIPTPRATTWLSPLSSLLRSTSARSRSSRSCRSPTTPPTNHHLLRRLRHLPTAPSPPPSRGTAATTPLPAPTLP
uniref:Uncharacterized protein n=1 Tax=Zea mays TaxID=4577 RepID=C4J672_MAIZE|nr:unknown [Zea mays]